MRAAVDVDRDLRPRTRGIAANGASTLRARRRQGLIQKALAAAAAIAFSAAHVAVAAAIFTPLGDLPGGFFFSDARGLSPDGAIVVGPTSVDGGSEAYRWQSATGMAGLGDLPGGDSNSIAHAVAADGSVVVGAGLSAGGDRAFRWTAAGGMVDLGLLPAGGDSSDARGVSADGAVVVGFNTSRVFEAFRWTAAEGMVGLGDLPGGFVSSRALGVSADGLVVVGVSSSDVHGAEAFRWTAAEGMVGLGLLPDDGTGLGSAAEAVSANGSVIVGASRAEAFRWTAGQGMVGLGRLPGGNSSYALAVSPDGAIVVGGAQTSSSQPGAFIWDAVHGMRNLQTVLIEAGANLAGWSLQDATGVTANGEFIVGSGVNPDGVIEAWLAHLPVPEPSSAVQFLAMAAVMSVGLTHRTVKRTSSFALSNQGV